MKREPTTTLSTEDNLILHYTNGDPAVRLQGRPNDICLGVARPGDHTFDTYALVLNEERIKALRDWCERQLPEPA